MQRDVSPKLHIGACRRVLKAQRWSLVGNYHSYLGSEHCLLPISGLAFSAVLATRDQQTFPANSQVVNIVDFVGSMVCFNYPTQLQAATDNARLHKHGFMLIKLDKNRQWVRLGP